MSASPTDPALFDVLARHRYRELDGLRGIASCIVGVTHAFEAIAIPTGLAVAAVLFHGAARIFNGDLAVDLFFIMSGFFLTGMLEGVRPGKLPYFYLRRIARLAPPAMLSVVLFYALLAGLPGLRLAALSQGIFSVPRLGAGIFGAGNILFNTLLVRHTLNTALWSIRIEILASLIFPFVLMVAHWRTSLAYQGALFAALLGIAFILRYDQHQGLDAAHYMPLFFAGILARQHGALLASTAANKQTRWLLLALLGACAADLLDPPGASHPFWYDTTICLCGGVIVALIAHGVMPALRRFLCSRPVQFLGRVSYSFYLVNMLAVRLAAQKALLTQIFASVIFVVAAYMLYRNATAMALG